MPEVRTVLEIKHTAARITQYVRIQNAQNVLISSHREECQHLLDVV